MQPSDIVFPPSGFRAPWAYSLPDIFHVSLRSLGHSHMTIHTLPEIQETRPSFWPCRSCCHFFPTVDTQPRSQLRSPRTGHRSSPFSDVQTQQLLHVCLQQTHSHPPRWLVGHWEGIQPPHCIQLSYFLSSSALLSPLRVRVSSVASEVGRMWVERRQGKMCAVCSNLLSVLLSMPGEGLLRLCY